MKELFLGGLEPELQKMTRGKLDGLETLKESILVAKYQEVELGKVRDSLRSRNVKITTSCNDNNNSNNSNNMCKDCGSSAPTRKRLCNKCFKSSIDNKKNNDANNN